MDRIIPGEGEGVGFPGKGDRYKPQNARKQGVSWEGKWSYQGRFMKTLFWKRGWADNEEPEKSFKKVQDMSWFVF